MSSLLKNSYEILTRKFIVLHKSLDFILAADSSTMANSALPSWTPNWVGTWHPSTVKLLNHGLQADQIVDFRTEGSLPHSLKVIGNEIAIAYSWASYPQALWSSANFYGGSRDDIQHQHDAVCEALFCDCFPSLESDLTGPYGNGVDSKELDLEQRLPKWFKSARRLLCSLGTPGNNRSELR